MLSRTSTRTSTVARSFSWRPVPFALLFGAIVAVLGRRGAFGRGSQGLVVALARDGLVAVADEIAWVDSPPRALFATLGRTTRAVVRAHARGELADVYLVRARVSPDGFVYGIASIHDLTRTKGADETSPALDGSHVAYTAVVEGVTTSIFDLDLGGDRSPPSPDMTRLARLQDALTNLQDTGQLAGVGRRGWTFDPSPSAVDFVWSGGQIDVVADGHRIRLPREGHEPLVGSALMRPHPSAKARPGNLVTWAVDRARALSWFGDDRMQKVKALAFAISDWANRIEKSLVVDASEKEIASDLGALAHVQPVTYTDPETGWPPPPMKPYILPALPGEGQWVPLDQDPFIPTNPGAPAAFATSFIRTDRERKYTRIYVTVWDPRQVAMHMMAGTVEPIGASGEAGPGLIPRTPEVIGRLVAAMNGGFQAMHGEWGMMGDGVVYLPPKPFGATVAELRDGSTGFGEWPREPEVPNEVLSYRQNLTALVKDEKFNPYARTWWGGTPPDQTDKVHTVRTGICLTRENFIAYFYGAEIAAEVLAQAMIQARCRFGLHLDMNVGHTGLEFYRVGPARELGPVGRPLQSDWEAEGPVPGLDGWNFRGRRMIRGMPLMNFPRYIHREARDFFYLTLRQVLPGPDIAGAPQGEGHWQTRGLPQHGFPYAIATTSLHPEPLAPNVLLLQVDPQRTRVQGAAGASDSAPVLVVFSNIARAHRARPTLWLGNGAFSISEAPPEGASELFSGFAPNDTPRSAAEAAVGITDEGGMLVYAEITTPGAPAPGTPAGAESKPVDQAPLLDRLLARLGCSSRMLLAHRLTPLLGGATPLGDAGPPPSEGATVKLVRGEGPAARPIFEDTPIVSPEVWQPLQMRRIRYFKKPTQPPPAKSAEPTPASGQDSE